MRPARSTVVATAVVMAAVGGLLTASSASASASTSCTSPVFKRQFFATTAFSGTPKKTDCDSAISESWSGAPARGLPKDNFGVRWTVTRDFGSGGPFAFSAEARGGIRVYLDGVRKVDLWKKVSTIRKQAVNVAIPAGQHSLRIDFVNWTGQANAKFAYAPRTTADVDKVKPLVPTGLGATYDKVTGRARIAWAKNKEMDLAGYRVYRRLRGEPFPAAPLVTTTSTSYTDIPPPTGSTYAYEIRAYDKAGNTSSGSAARGVTTVDKTPPARVVATVAMGTDRTRESYVVRWQPVADAVRYRVLHQLLVDGQWKWSEAAVTTGTSVTDYVPVTGAAVWYRVEAYDAAGNVRPAGSGDEVHVDAFWEHRATDVTAAYQGDNRALLQWSLPKDTFAIRGDQIRLLRGVGTPSWEETTPPQYCISLKYADDGDHFRYSCVAEVTPGGTNFFAVEPYLSASLRALPSAIVPLAVPAAPMPATDFTGVSDGRRVDFRWTASASGDVDHYELHSGVWHPATSPAEEGWFYTYTTDTVPGDTTSIRWRYLLTQELDFVLVAVAKDGTRLSTSQSPRLRMEAPAAG
ncbi:PA14 domain-containing protein [Streptomyces galbus]|uniref:Cellulose 1,4-beta-cellobiosidase n=1 Tax=Streptomyces galbus TaxID=33898 RepID=A0A4U5X396_STRGB|nr:PA14 domain-containing protein [Streptomyces galbus]TKT08491.1 cellulose 1,4-beta-cellobiosidase [Streptomyces galbus]